MEDINYQIEFNKSIRQYKQSRTIKECFYHKKEECKGKIKQAHSIQRNKRLSIIEEEVSGNNVLYSFTEFEIGTTDFIKKLLPIGKANASTFFGFCDFHDTKLFSEIENNEFDNSAKHCFLHSYRSFAHSYHRKLEETKGNSYRNSINKDYPEEFNQSMLYGNKLAVKDVLKNKKKLDEWIENENYEELEYYSIIFPELYPIASSSIISPFYSIKGFLINGLENFEDTWSSIIFTVLPDFNQTIVIFACFPEDKNGIMFLNELDELNDFQLKRVISTILVHYAENTFISPSLWRTLEKRGQKLLCREIEHGIHMGLSYMPTNFEYSKLNLFESRYEYRNLK